jgi:hypothetical protein
VHAQLLTQLDLLIETNGHQLKCCCRHQPALLLQLHQQCRRHAAGSDRWLRAVTQRLVVMCLLCCRDAALQRAEGDKVTLVKAAEAEAEATYLQGQGISRQRQVSLIGPPSAFWAPSAKDSIVDPTGKAAGCSRCHASGRLLHTGMLVAAYWLSVLKAIYCKSAAPARHIRCTSAAAETVCSVLDIPSACLRCPARPSLMGCETVWHSLEMTCKE